MLSGRPTPTRTRVKSPLPSPRFSEPQDEVRELVERAADELDGLVSKLSE